METKPAGSGAKQIHVRIIDAPLANAFVKANHYSGKVVPNSQLHFGVYLNKVLHGVMSFGPSINKKGTINLVAGTKWNEFTELNRMAFDDILPKNSESRALSVAMRIIKARAPHIKWVISFADATQSGHGVIYQATGFVLTGIVANTSIRVDPKTGAYIHIIQAHHLKIPSKVFRSWRAISGYMLRYVYFIKPECKKLLVPPPIPFSKIKAMGIGMYKGNKLAQVA